MLGTNRRLLLIDKTFNRLLFPELTLKTFDSFKRRLHAGEPEGRIGRIRAVVLADNVVDRGAARGAQEPAVKVHEAVTAAVEFREEPL